jgi:acyltransferase
MILVFYGHVLQNGLAAASAGAAAQMRVIYAFHMPLFFVTSGFFFKPAAHLGPRVRQLALRRLVPVLFFGVLLLPPWIHTEATPTVSWAREAWQMAGSYAMGRPLLDWPTWFLVCLFVCEILAALPVERRLASVWARCGVASIALLAGVLWSNRSLSPDDGAAYVLGRTWFLSEALVALGFFTVGSAVFPVLRRQSGRPGLWLALFVVGVAITVATAGLNPAAGDCVMMAARRHGDVAPFVVTALAGSLAAVALGILCARAGWLQAIGRNTLPLLGINGFFFHYANHRIEARLAGMHGHPTVEALVITAATLAISWPLARLLETHVPQLVGKWGVSA